MSKVARPLPRPTPDTQHFWDGCKANELRLQACKQCDHVYFPPRPFCPSCSSRDVEIRVASGRATLASYVINERPHPAFDGPYAIAIVDLEIKFAVKIDQIAKRLKTICCHGKYWYVLHFITEASYDGLHLYIANI